MPGRRKGKPSRLDSLQTSISSNLFDDLSLLQRPSATMETNDFTIQSDHDSDEGEDDDEEVDVGFAHRTGRSSRSSKKARYSTVRKVIATGTGLGMNKEYLYLGSVELVMLDEERHSVNNDYYLKLCPQNGLYMTNSTGHEETIATSKGNVTDKSLWKSFREAIDFGIISVELSRTSPPVSVLVYMDKTCLRSAKGKEETPRISLCPKLLDMCLGNRNIDRPSCFEFDEVLDDFDPKEFINDVTESSKAILGTVGMPSIVELAKKLRDAGLSTELKKYQLEGVYWLWEQFCGRGRQFSSSLVSNGLAEAAPWFKLVTDPHEPAQILWFNIFSHELFLGPSPPLCDIKTHQSFSCILSDEPGLGKTLTCLSLAVLVKGNVPVPQNHSHKSSTEADENNHKIYGRIRDSQGCLCGKTDSSKDIGFIQCDTCSRWCHLTCSGLSTEEVDALDKFECLACCCNDIRSSGSLLKTRCVLIVVPDPIVQQWTQEISKHFIESALIVRVYEGCDKKLLRSNSFRSLYPRELGKADVIIISLRTLQTEYHLANMFPEGRRPTEKTTSLRGGKSASSRHSDDYFCPPWLCLDFSLLVIDETQKIESLNSSASSMCNRIAAGYRISVSATPLANNKQSDLRPLCDFLRVKPFCVDRAEDQKRSPWLEAFTRKIGNLKLSSAAKNSWLKQVILPLIIRRTKSSVYHELGLPPKQIIVRKLQLSAFEMALYKENRDLAVGSAERLMSSGTPSDEIQVSTLNQLGSLRKLCCHPQVWNSNLQSTGGVTLPFKSIMCVKVEEQRTRAEEAQRQLLYHLFSMAGSNLLLAEISRSTCEPQRAGYYDCRALATYQYAHDILNSNRNPVPLCGTLKVTGNDSVGPEELIACVDGYLVVCCDTHAPNDFTLQFSTGRRLLQLELNPVLELLEGQSEMYISLPKCVELYANIGLGDSMTLINSVQTPAPASAQTNGNLALVMNIPEIRSMRARSWRLRVVSYHDACVMVKANTQGSDDVFLLDSAPPMAHPQMKCRVMLKDSGLCADLFQELHLLENLHLISKSSQSSVNTTQITSIDMLGQNFFVQHSDNTMTPVSSRFSQEVGDSPARRKDLFGVSYVEESTVIGNNCIVSSSSCGSGGGGTTQMLMPLSFTTQNLQARKDAIHEAFMTQIESRRKASRYRLKQLVETTEGEIRKLISVSPNRERKWWLNMIGSDVASDQFSRNMVYAIQTTVSECGVAYASLRNCERLVEIGAVFEQEFKEIQAARKKVIDEILGYNPSEEEVVAASNCKIHAAYFNKQGPVCSCCRLEKYLEAYDSRLFAYRSITKRIVAQSTQSRRGTESDEALEMKEMNEQRVPGTFMMLTTHFKHYASNLYRSDVKRAAMQEITIINAMQGELVGLTSLWQSQLAYLKGRDELQMATSRVSLIDDSVMRDDDQTNFLYAAEVEPNFFEAINAAAIAKNELNTSLSSLAFYKKQLQSIQTTRKQANDGDVDNGVVICPICLEDMVECGGILRASFLPCAHRFHDECIRPWLDKVRKCPCCKHPSTLKDIHIYREDSPPQRTPGHHSFPSSSSSSSSSASMVPSRRRVRGEWGTKIDQLLRDMLAIADQEDTEKCIIFSTWTDMLHIVGTALKENSLDHVMCLGPKDFRGRGSKLNRFKLSPNINILLMPLSLGAEGLDLIVANNIVLLEPLLNSSIELQALNRCDRLGQTRSTRVYKYVSLGTIEEKIMNRSDSGLTEEGGTGTRRVREKITAATLQSLLEF